MRAPLLASTTEYEFIMLSKNNSYNPLVIIIRDNAYLPMEIQMKEKARQSGGSMPPRKPLSEHKQSMTVSIDPSNRQWVREHFRDNGFRNESHLVDEAIRLLKEKSDNDANK